MRRIEFKIGVPRAGSSARLAEQSAQSAREEQAGPARMLRISGGDAARLAEEAGRAALRGDGLSPDPGGAWAARRTLSTTLSLRGEGGRVTRRLAPPAAGLPRPAAPDDFDSAYATEIVQPSPLQRSSLGAAVHSMVRKLRLRPTQRPE